MKKILLKSFSFFLCLTMVCFAANAETITSSTFGGNWNSSSTWNTNTIPTAADDVILQGPVTLNIAATINSLFIDINSTLTIGGTNTLTCFSSIVSGTLTISGSGSIIGNLNFNSGSTYRHNRSAGTIPTATWNLNSNCILGDWGSAANTPANLIGQTFGNFSVGPFANGGGGTGYLVTTGSGTITVAGNFTLNNGSTTTRPIGLSNSTGAINLSIGGNFIMPSGTFAVKNNSGATTLSIGGNFNQSGGTFDQRPANATSTAVVSVSGNFLLSGGTYDISGTNNATGELNVSGNFSHTAGTLTASGGGTSNGAIVFNGSSSQTFTSGGTVSNAINYTVNTGSTLQMAAATTVVNGNSFILLAGGTLGITSTAGITAAVATATGNIRTTGERTFNTGANYIYNGAGGAQVSGSGLPATIRRLTINNAAGVSLTNAVSLVTNVAATNPLILTSGILSGSKLTISNAYTGAGGAGSATSHVSVPMAKTGSTNYEFPIGNGSIYRPISVATLSGSATLTATYVQANPKTAFGNTLGAGIDHIGICEYWDLDDGAATITGRVGLKFGTSCNSSPYVNAPASLLVAHFTGGQWNSQGNNGTATMTSVTSNTASTFSPFTIGSSTGLNPLPVKFSDVKAYSKQNGVQIDWTNLTESNLVNYIVERSVNGVDFIVINQVAPRSNTADKEMYSSFDASPVSGANFYRIKAIETDGKIIYSKLLKVSIGTTVKGLSLFPNPVTNNIVTIGFSGAKGQYIMRIINAAGQEVFTKTIVHSGGTLTEAITLPSAINKGLYSLLIAGDNYRETKLFIIQ